ncbi:collagen alpha-1(I) chain isoform X2 [Rhipicephalus sanguineus]|uniref:collagen alpha-1(I) chain isoform X2 n=1 Tax=Rhipicephalus sanguineus TaxID=34632 RepID=UPI00189626FC|nr:collagen alpha-1(I) chain isoform X2 [Rhipicephalus sanguineus]
MNSPVVFNIIIIVLLQVSRISNGGIPGNILMRRIRAGLQGAGGPGGGGFFGGPGPDGGVGMRGSSPDSRMGPNREIFPFGGRGLGDSVLGPGGPPFRGPLREDATPRHLIDFTGGGGHLPGPDNSRSLPSMRPPTGPRFRDESGEGSEEGLFGLSRKPKELRERDHAEHQRGSVRGSQDGNAGIHGGKHSEHGFHGGPLVGIHDLGDHGSGSKVSTSGHGSGRSHRRASNDEDDYRTEEKDDKASHKGRSESISTFEALSLARQCLNLLHDMLVLLTTNRKE